MSPVSSASSRWMAAARVSPSSTRPPGRLQESRAGSWPRRTKSDLVAFKDDRADAHQGLVGIMAFDGWPPRYLRGGGQELRPCPPPKPPSQPA